MLHGTHSSNADSQMNKRDHLNFAYIERNTHLAYLIFANQRIH